MTRISVLMVDDHAILREGLRALLSHYDDVEVVGEAQDGNEAVELVERLRPDVVLMDAAMPDMGGLEATRLIRKTYPQSRVLVLTQHDDYRYIRSFLQADASGYVTKRAVGTDLVNALHAVARGETFLQPSIASKLAEQIRHPDEPQEDRLTPREQETLTHIALGKTNRQIAFELSISVKTVEWHRSNLMSKLDAHCVADLVRYAMKAGLIGEGE